MRLEGERGGGREIGDIHHKLLLGVATLQSCLVIEIALFSKCSFQHFHLRFRLFSDTFIVLIRSLAPMVQPFILIFTFRIPFRSVAT